MHHSTTDEFSQRTASQLPPPLLFLFYTFIGDTTSGTEKALRTQLQKSLMSVIIVCLRPFLHHLVLPLRSIANAFRIKLTQLDIDALNRDSTLATGETNTYVTVGNLSASDYAGNFAPAVSFAQAIPISDGGYTQVRILLFSPSTVFSLLSGHERHIQYENTYANEPFSGRVFCSTFGFLSTIRTTPTQT